MAGALAADAIGLRQRSNTPTSSAPSQGHQPELNLPSDRLFLDFSGSGESADICSPLIAQLAIGGDQLTCSFPPSECSTIPEFGNYEQQSSMFGPVHQNNHGKQSGRRKYRVGRLEGLKVAHIWCQDYKGRLLRKAVQVEDTNTIRDLLNEGVLVDNADDKQRTALHLASVKGNLAIVELLLTKGANPNCKDVNQNTPLMLACLSRNIPTITMLLKRGANPNLCDSKGNNALTIAQNRLTHLQQCQVACDYLRDELMHIITMIKEYVHQRNMAAIENQPTNLMSNDVSSSALSFVNKVSIATYSNDEVKIEEMISRLSFSSSGNENSHSITETQNITQQVADEFHELLVKFNSQVKLT